MTKKDLIRLLLKLMGVLVLINSLPPILSMVVLISSAGGNNTEALLWMPLAIIITIGFSCWLIFYPDTIVNFFKLDKGFDDNEVKIEQLKAEKLASIAVFMIGGMFILYSFAPLLVEIGYKIEAMFNQGSLFTSFSSDNTRLYTNIIELCAGFLLITNYGRVTRYLLSVNKKNEGAE